MYFRVEFSTYDAELIAVLQKAKGKKPYLIEKALTHFIASQTGKEIVNALMSKKEERAAKKLATKKEFLASFAHLKDKTKKENAVPVKKKKILIDNFL